MSIESACTLMALDGPRERALGELAELRRLHEAANAKGGK